MVTSLTKPSLQFLQNNFIGLTLEGISYGIYCMVLGAYLRIQFKKKDGPISLLVYPLTVNFILSTAYFVISIIQVQWFLTLVLENDSPFKLWNTLSNAVNALYICIDFISQATLIYRCWMMWHQLSVVVVPIILTLAFLGTALAALISQIIITLHYDTADLLPTWYYSAAASSFSISLAVNALVTGFMIFKILTVYREFQGFNLKTNAGRSPQTDQPLHIISIFAESGLLTFVAQLVQIILYQRPAFPLVSGLIVMVYGISTTVVLIRIEMGLATQRFNETPRTFTGIHFAGFKSRSGEHELPGRYRSEGHLPDSSEMRVIQSVS